MIQKIINWIKKVFSDYFEIHSDCHMSHRDLTNSLTKQFVDCAVFITDDKLNLIYQKDTEKLKSLNFSRTKKYKPTVWDCEDFAFTMKGIMSRFYGGFAFGIVFVRTNKGNHALNCFVDEFGRFNYFEPQSNKIFITKEGYEPYLIVI